MGLKDLFLNRGWAGTTLSRQETIVQLNPLLRRQHALNQEYSHVAYQLTDREAAARLEGQTKTARTDLAKLRETVLSLGGTPYSGTDLKAEDVDLPTNQTAMLETVDEHEQGLQDALTDELDRGDHQMRTRAILEVVQTNSQRRLDLLNQLLNEARRHAPAS